MKTIVIITIGLVLMITGRVLGQTNDSTPAADTAFATHVTLSGFSDVHEGAKGGLGLSFCNIPNAISVFKEVHIGLNFFQKGIGAEIGIDWCKKSWRNGKIKFVEIIGLEYYAETSIFVAHGSLISKTFQGPSDQMVGSFVIGPKLEFWNRVSIFATFNPGISWFPSGQKTWNSNGSYNFGGGFGVAVKL